MFTNQKTTRQGNGMAVEDALKLLAAILAATVLAVNLSIVRPMKDRMEELQHEVVGMQSQLQLLVGERDQVRSTNDLLTGLKAQETAFEEARHSLATLRQFREDMSMESQKATEALGSLEKLDGLQKTVLHYRDLTEPAGKVLTNLIDLQKQLIDQNATADDAIDAVNRLAALKRNVIAEASDSVAADAALGQMANLKTQIINQAADMPTADARTQQLINLKSQIVEKTTDIDLASSALEGVLAVKDELVVRGGQISEALQIAERLLGLRDRLAANSIKNDAAERSASQMIAVQKKLAGAHPNLADSIKSIETMIDFQHEFEKQVRSLDGMRRNLMDFIMLENTVAQAVRMLQPLLELGNLRHLNEDQLRQIARSISEGDATKVSKNESGHGPGRPINLGPSQYNRDEVIDAPKVEDSVPWPTDAE